MYLDFIDEPANSLRRKREGLYVSYTFGQGDKAVKVKNDALIIKADPWATLRAENKYVIHWFTQSRTQAFYSAIPHVRAGVEERRAKSLGTRWVCIVWFE